ncbi:hypothetical protein B0H19DRAFT_1076619 [Mycena capillaripes]|nr:hypothetical protein B0H19DRAFT_1076619 [Mycena capillaripes]
MLLAVKAADPDVSLMVFKNSEYAIRHADRSGDLYHPILFLQWNTPHYDGVRKCRVLAHGPEDFRTIGAAGTRIDCARDGVAGTGVRIPIFAVSTLVRVVLKPPSRLPHFLVAKPRPVRASRQGYGLCGYAQSRRNHPFRPQLHRLNDTSVPLLNRSPTRLGGASKKNENGRMYRSG